jgi:hypothetical protein
MALMADMGWLVAAGGCMLTHYHYETPTPSSIINEQFKKATPKNGRF